MIELVVPSGTLSEHGRQHVQGELAAVLLRWEGAPDTALFRGLAWSYLHELPVGAQVTAQDDVPRFLVRVTVPAGALSQRRKAGLIEDVTGVVLQAAGLSAADSGRVWVLVNEQPDGTWGAGGAVVRFADLVAMTADAVGSQRAGAVDA